MLVTLFFFSRYFLVFLVSDYWWIFNKEYCMCENKLSTRRSRVAHAQISQNLFPERRDATDRENYSDSFIVFFHTHVLTDYCRAVFVCVLMPHPDCVGLSQPYRIRQFDLDLSTVEGSKHAHHLQQPVIQAAG